MIHEATQLVTLADLYAAAHKLSRTTVSSRVFDDARKMDAMADGGADITLRRFNQALSWFSDNWPDGVQWPRHIARPSFAPRDQGAAA